MPPDCLKRATTINHGLRNTSKGLIGSCLSISTEHSTLFYLSNSPLCDQRLACPALAGERVGQVRVMGILGFSFESGFEAPGFVSGLDNLVMVGQAVEQCK
jgi:hypothetical protein